MVRAAAPVAGAAGDGQRRSRSDGAEAVEGQALIWVGPAQAVCCVGEGDDRGGVSVGDDHCLPSLAATLVARVAWPQIAAHEDSAR